MSTSSPSDTTSRQLDELLEPFEMYGAVDGGYGITNKGELSEAKARLSVLIEEALTSQRSELLKRVETEVIGKDEPLKNVKNRSILDSPKVKVQNLYRSDRNMFRASQRQALKALEEMK